MYDTVLLLAQAGATAFIAAWLTLGARDNILYPSLNENYTADVLAMGQMKQQYPEEFAKIAHRAITNRRVQRAAFALVVIVETLASLLLWIGTGALLLALFGITPAETARALALFGALIFTSVWAGFLVIGNHFCYWFCHEGAQNTHYQMTLWGLGTMIFIALG